VKIFRLSKLGATMQRPMNSICTMAILFAWSSCQSTSSADFQAGLYATARYDNEVIHINSDGTWTPALVGLQHPFGLAFRDSNTLYVTEAGSNFDSGGGGKLNGYNSDGTKVFSAGPIPATNRYPNGSWGFGIAIDSQGTAYIATHNSPGATKVTSDGVVSDWTGYQYNLWWGKEATFSPSGDLYMTNGLFALNEPSNVVKIDKVTGQVTTVLSGLDYTGGISFDSQGNMYLTQWRLNRIVEVPAGTTSLVPIATITNPFLSTFGPDGYLYVIGDYGDATEQIWKVNVQTGATYLVADNLPFMDDIAFAPIITSPTPPSVVLLSSGIPVLFVGFLKSLRRRLAYRRDTHRRPFLLVS
jgi:hypothetical protein